MCARSFESYPGTSHCLSIRKREGTGLRAIYSHTGGPRTVASRRRFIQSLPCSMRRVWISEIRVSAPRSASTLV